MNTQDCGEHTISQTFFIPEVNGGVEIIVTDNEKKHLPKRSHNHYREVTGHGEDPDGEGYTKYKCKRCGVCWGSTPGGYIRDGRGECPKGDYENPKYLGADISSSASRVAFSATDLFGTVAEEKEEDPGAYVHYNIDNDNNSNNAQGAPKHPGGDYLEVDDPVTGEDDLKLAIITLPYFLKGGKVILKRNNTNMRIWKSPQKWSIKKILVDSNEKTWNLSDSVQRAEFNYAKNRLWVEGYNKDTSQLSVELRGANNKLLWTDTIKYTFIAADCGDQPKTEGVYAEGMSEREAFETSFPSLIRCEWSITGEITDTYNCIAWSVGETSEWYAPWDIDQEYGDNNGIFETSDMDGFYLDKKGWTPTASGPSDAEAMYYPYPRDWDYIHEPNPPGDGYHGAKKKGCDCGAGKWIMFESKCGEGAKIEHVDDQLNESSYGSHDRYYK